VQQDGVTLYNIRDVSEGEDISPFARVSEKGRDHHQERSTTAGTLLRRERFSRQIVMRD
jgi:hypothetical protein